MILTCHSYVTVYIYPRNSHLKSLASYFGLQVSRTYPHVYYSFLLRTSAIQSLTQTDPYHKQANWERKECGQLGESEQEVVVVVQEDQVVGALAEQGQQARYNCKDK